MCQILQQFCGVATITHQNHSPFHFVRRSMFENTRIETQRFGKIFPLCSQTPVGIKNSSV